MTTLTNSTLLSTPRNAKLGHLIHAWSLPVITTCPGATDFCQRLCYATKSHFCSPHVQALYQRNLVHSHDDDFAMAMRHEIRRNGVLIVRIHVSGDFYDAAYVAKWHTIAAASPRTRFFAYTRSWRDAAMLPGLTALGQLSNMELWWSEDRETGPSPAVPGIRTCFLVHDATDEIMVEPSRHDLVFRDSRHRARSVNPQPVKRIQEVLVCPHEQQSQRRGQLRDDATWRTPLTCSQCRICFTTPKEQH